VAERLTRLGHSALTPSLAGLGERSHELSRHITLETHAADVVDVVESQPEARVILVGHSYGGAVITVAASRLSDRVRGLIYVDAFIPTDGQCVIDLVESEWAEVHVLESARSSGDGWLVPFPFPEDLADMPVEVADRYRSSWQPLATFTEPCAVDASVADLPTAFVHCVRKEQGHDAFLDSKRIARDRGWLVREIHAGHDVQIEDPDGIASLLHDLAAELALL